MLPKRTQESKLIENGNFIPNLLRPVLNEPNFSKKFQSSKYLEPLRRRSSKCFPNIWNEVGPEIFRLVASKFWSLFRRVQSTHVRAATSKPRASLTTQSQLRSWVGHGRPYKARRASRFDITSCVADVLFRVFGGFLGTQLPSSQQSFTEHQGTNKPVAPAPPTARAT